MSVKTLNKQEMDSIDLAKFVFAFAVIHIHAGGGGGGVTSVFTKFFYFF